MHSASPESSVLEKLGFVFLCAFIFLVFSRVTDFVVPYLHLPLATSLLAIGAALLSGGIQRAVLSTPGKLLMAFTVWLIASIPFSFWRGGSYGLVKDGWSKSLLVFLMMAGLLRTLTHCRRMMLVLAAAGLTVAVISFLFGERAYGRLVMSAGVLANSNEIAQILLITMPFLGILGVEKSNIPFRRTVGLFGTVPMLGVIMITGSRGAIVGMAVVFAVVFLFASIANKMKLTALAMIGIAVAMVVMPNALWQRYRTLFTPQADVVAQDQIEAVDSTYQRIALLREAVRLTIRHPLFGVGAGQFEPAAAADAQERKEPAMWRETHNTYLQLSSETGIPGMLLFVSVLFLSFRDSFRVYRFARGRADLATISAMAYALFLSWLAFTVMCFFNAIAYQMYLPALAGITTAFMDSARPHLQGRSEPVSAAVRLQAAPAVNSGRSVPV